MAYTTEGLNSILRLLLNNHYLGLGVGGVEVVGKGYSRVACSEGNFTISNGVATNQSKIKFPESTAAWGIVNTLFIYTTQVGGVCLFQDTLNQTANVNDEDIIVKFDVYDANNKGLRIAVTQNS